MTFSRPGDRYTGTGINFIFKCISQWNDHRLLFPPSQNHTNQPPIRLKEKCRDFGPICWFLHTCVISCCRISIFSFDGTQHIKDIIMVVFGHHQNDITHAISLIFIIYRKISNISRKLVGSTIVDHSDVVGASPVGAAPTTSLFSTWHLASRDSAKKAARQYDNLSRLDGICRDRPWLLLYIYMPHPRYVANIYLLSVLSFPWISKTTVVSLRIAVVYQ